MLWTSGNVSFGFQSQNGQPYSDLAEADEDWSTFPVFHIWCYTCRNSSWHTEHCQQRWVTECSNLCQTSELLTGSTALFSFRGGGRKIDLSFLRFTSGAIPADLIAADSVPHIMLPAQVIAKAVNSMFQFAKLITDFTLICRTFVSFIWLIQIFTQLEANPCRHKMISN